MLETSKKMYSLIVLICRWCGLIVSACRWLEYSPPSGPQPDSTATLPVETLPVVCCCHRLIYSHCIEVNKKWFRVVSNGCWGPELEVSKSGQRSGEVDASPAPLLGSCTECDHVWELAEKMENREIYRVQGGPLSWQPRHTSQGSTHCVKLQQLNWSDFEFATDKMTFLYQK